MKKTISKNPREEILLICGRNFGDSIVTAGWLEKTSAILPYNWIVWCRPSVAPFFQNIKAVTTVYSSEFPVGTKKNFNWRAALKLLSIAKTIRRRTLLFSVDLFGDFREALLAKLCGSKTHLTLAWPNDHLASRMIRRAPSWLISPISFRPPVNTSFYDAYALFATHLIKNARLPSDRVISITNATPTKAVAPMVVGLHPFASEVSREWPDENWNNLARQLQNIGYQVIAFGARNDLPRLHRIFEGALNSTSFRTDSLVEFGNQIKQLDVLIGLDSLSIHMAARAGIPSIALIGPSSPKLWLPPNCTYVSAPGACTYQPCFNKPKCRGKDWQYICMRSIAVDLVIQTTVAALSHARLTP